MPEHRPASYSRPSTGLLPFVPVLKGGDDEVAVRRALRALRADERLSELEPLLAFFASFVLETRVVQQIMRWDMAVLPVALLQRCVSPAGHHRQITVVYRRDDVQG